MSPLFIANMNYYINYIYQRVFQNYSAGVKDALIKKRDYISNDDNYTLTSVRVVM